LSTTSDTVYRLGIEKEEDALHDEFDEFVFFHIKQPVCAENVAKKTRRDPHLGKILEAGQDLTRAGYKAPEVNY